MPDLAATAEELYQLPPSEFTAARDQAAANARRERDLLLARAIKALHRPTTAAWLADQLVIHDRKAMEQFTAIGTSLRQAQQHLEGERLRELLAQRRQLVTALVAQARTLAREAGVKVSDGVEQELTETLLAALADPDAARALLTGRLTAALHPDSVMPGPADAAAKRARPTSPGPKATITAVKPKATRQSGAAAANRELERERLRRSAEQLREEASRADAAAREAEQKATEAQYQAELAEHDQAEADQRQQRAARDLEAAKAALRAAEANLAAAQETQRTAADTVGPARTRAKQTAADARARRAGADRLQDRLAKLTGRISQTP